METCRTFYGELKWKQMFKLLLQHQPRGIIRFPVPCRPGGASQQQPHQWQRLVCGASLSVHSWLLLIGPCSLLNLNTFCRHFKGSVFGRPTLHFLLQGFRLIWGQKVPLKPGEALERLTGNQWQQCHTVVKLHFFQDWKFPLKDLKCQVWN